MKKFTKFVLSCSFAVSSLFISHQAHADTPVKVQVNDSLVSFPDAQPSIDNNNRTLVPVRFVSEKLGYHVDYQMKGPQVAVTISKESNTISFTTGQNTAIVNGKKIVMDTKALFKDSCTYVPIRFITDAMHVRIQWDPNNYIVILDADGLYHAPAWYKYKETLTMLATAYSDSPSENGIYGGVDYFGNLLKLGTVAVDPNIIPLGSKLYIQGYSANGLPAGGFYATALDEGSAIVGKRIDIFIPGPKNVAENFGMQYVKVNVLN